MHYDAELYKTHEQRGNQYKILKQIILLKCILCYHQTLKLIRPRCIPAFSYTVTRSDPAEAAAVALDCGLRGAEQGSMAELSAI